MVAPSLNVSCNKVKANVVFLEELVAYTVTEVTEMGEKCVLLYFKRHLKKKCNNYLFTKQR